MWKMSVSYMETKNILFRPYSAITLGPIFFNQILRALNSLTNILLEEQLSLLKVKYEGQILFYILVPKCESIQPA